MSDRKCGKVTWIIVAMLSLATVMLLVVAFHSEAYWRGELARTLDQEMAPVSAEEPVHWQTLFSYRHDWEKPDTYDQFLEVLSDDDVPLLGLNYSYECQANGIVGEVTLTIDTHGNDVNVVMEGEELP